MYEYIYIQIYTCHNETRAPRRHPPGVEDRRRAAKVVANSCLGACIYTYTYNAYIYIYIYVN